MFTSKGPSGLRNRQRSVHSGLRYGRSLDQRRLQPGASAIVRHRWQTWLTFAARGALLTVPPYSSIAMNIFSSSSGGKSSILLVRASLMVVRGRVAFPPRDTVLANSSTHAPTELELRPSECTLRPVQRVIGLGRLDATVMLRPGSRDDARAPPGLLAQRFGQALTMYVCYSRTR